MEVNRPPSFHLCFHHRPFRPWGFLLWLWLGWLCATHGTSSTKKNEENVNQPNQSHHINNHNQPHHPTVTELDKQETQPQEFQTDGATNDSNTCEVGERNEAAATTTTTTPTRATIRKMAAVPTIHHYPIQSHTEKNPNRQRTNAEPTWVSRSSSSSSSSSLLLSASSSVSSSLFVCEDRLSSDRCREMIQDWTKLLLDDDDAATNATTAAAARNSSSPPRHLPNANNSNHTCIRKFEIFYPQCRKTCRMCDSIDSTRLEMRKKRRRSTWHSDEGDEGDGNGEEEVVWVSNVYNEVDQEIPQREPSSSFPSFLSFNDDDDFGSYHDNHSPDDDDNDLDLFAATWEWMSRTDDYMYRHLYGQQKLDFQIGNDNHNDQPNHRGPTNEPQEQPKQQPHEEDGQQQPEVEYPLWMRLECRNRDAQCSIWAVTGECSRNKAFMQSTCAPACHTCPTLDFNVRCRRHPSRSKDPHLQDNDEDDENENQMNAWSQPGDLHRTFTRIVEHEPYQQLYNPKILSKPSGYQEKKNQNNAIGQSSNSNPKNDSTNLDTKEEKEAADGPWIVLLENFLTGHECQTLIELGAKQGYERSRDVGNLQYDGSYGNKEYHGRTSTNAWCTEDCFYNTTVQQIQTRLQDLLQFSSPPGSSSSDLPSNNSNNNENDNNPPQNDNSHYEFWQLLRYETGQYYQIHHDYVPQERHRTQGPRIVTIFLYLNTIPPEHGGGTHFPLLHPPLTVQPQQGQALIWPSVLDDHPLEVDIRTHHQALQVLDGVKYGANVWVHQRDYKDAYQRNCQ